MPSYSIDNFCEWIWIPPGFAHGNFFYQETKIEYFCTGQYNSKCEAGISPFSEDIDWSICNIELYRDFIFYKNKYPLISDKDKDGLSLEKWSNDERSNNFIY
jgi:dTDP-4-dehydrorhamnose 3,5-epimerase-like enzyme